MINISNTIHQTSYQPGSSARSQNIASNKDNKTSAINEIKQTRNEEDGSETKNSHSTNTENKAESELGQAEIKQLRELRSRDQEVRAHEQAHTSAAGSLAKGGPSYEYERGPDGQLYAVGGEVKIDTSAVPGDPKATAVKAAQVKRAALAPTQPSQQDRSVAAAAAALEAQARIEIAKQRSEKAAEVINEKFSAEKDSSENGKSKETSTETNIQTQSKCAECGGQHSAESHSVAVKLGNAYNQPEIDNFFPYQKE